MLLLPVLSYYTMCIPFQAYLSYLSSTEESIEHGEATLMKHNGHFFFYKTQQECWVTLLNLDHVEIIFGLIAISLRFKTLPRGSKQFIKKHRVRVKLFMDIFCHCRTNVRM